MDHGVRRRFDAVAEGLGFRLDADQTSAADRLSVLAGEVGVGRRRLLRHAPRGVYLWGPVGRGKSWLMDTFYAALPTEAKRRVHFHEFFRDLQEAVFRHREDAHTIDPAMAELVGDAAVLCFDEFHVHDPGDAMLVTRLLRELFGRRITLVATSNYAPAGLLPSPLHHHLFEPAIRLIEQKMDVVGVAGPRDYRTGADPDTGSAGGFTGGALLSPGDAAQLHAHGLVRPGAAEETALVLNRRTLTARAVRGPLVWFDYRRLCEATTATPDYLALADRFDTWVLDGVPDWDDCSRDGRQRLANVVDVAYDRDIVLYLIGPGRPAQPAPGAEVPPDFVRTASRLGLLRERVGG
ncbi:cell division protein ZapE [Embleya sp. AB8]|uniref:cell division protein ZapE n=1 Tax=Embleya sp. AB8 TaxID=3156304 RepID=UPI003C77915F